MTKRTDMDKRKTKTDLSTSDIGKEAKEMDKVNGHSNMETYKKANGKTD